MDISSPARLPSCSTFRSLPVFRPKRSLLAHSSVPFQASGRSKLLIQRQGGRIKARSERIVGAIQASAAETTLTEVEERWLLVPIGDGDSRHIGFKVQMPEAFEIASGEVTVGRLPGKADVVIPVATVSALHARLQKKGGSLLVTDLDSTNGTFIENKRLRPGAVATVSSGSRITFGDSHLAMFRVSKLENVTTKSEPQESEAEEQAENGSKGT